MFKDVIVVQYSPFDVLDRQKEMLAKRGFLKKQGGSKGGNKSWMKRWFELENNQLVYYVDQSKKQTKGALDLKQAV